MDRELEEQLNQLFDKTLNDLKVKAGRLIGRHQKRILKNYANELKSASRGGGRNDTRESRDNPRNDNRQRKAAPPKYANKRAQKYKSNDTDSDSGSGDYDEYKS